MISHRGGSPKYRRSERHPVPVQELELHPLGYVTQCQDDCHYQPSSRLFRRPAYSTRAIRAGCCDVSLLGRPIC